jgi:hypothetical protein
MPTFAIPFEKRGTKTKFIDNIERDNEVKLKEEN